ncbi:HK97 gp10 family phage protein [Leuconostoc lactis]|uniref:HK97 gp10 family phage protein n=1 Tax=Leuconostoc lactis TaxID=1246 RepID=UPI00351ED75D
MDDDILGLNELLALAGGLTEFSIEERDEINSAGATVLEEALTKATKDAKHYSNRQVSKSDIKHLADSVKVGSLEGSAPNGDKAVGFSTDDANHARIARMLNDGTKYIQGDSFWDEALANNEDKAQDAQAKVIQSIMDKKEG